MTPQEKAENIIKRFYDPYLTNTDMENAKRCARICVDEIKKHLISTEICFKNNIEPIGNYKYWIEVKEEIEKL